MVGLSIGANPNQIWDLKTIPLNYGQTVADGPALRIDRRYEVIVVAVANAPKYLVDSH